MISLNMDQSLRKVNILLSILFSWVIFTNAGNAHTIDNEKIKSPIFVGTKFHYGFIIPHAEELKEISESNTLSKLFESEPPQRCNCLSSPLAKK